MKLKNKSHEIKKVLPCLPMSSESIWEIKNWPEAHSGGPKAHHCQPTTDLLNSAEFGCSEENERCSGGYPELIYSAGGIKIGLEAHSGMP